MRHKKRTLTDGKLPSPSPKSQRAEPTAERYLYCADSTLADPFVDAAESLTPRRFRGAAGECFFALATTARALGGETQQLLRATQLLALFFPQTLPRAIAIDRPEWARALAFEFRGFSIASIPPGEGLQHLGALPVEKLPLVGDPQLVPTDEDAPLVEALRRLGLRHIAAFTALPRAAVQKRFGLYAIRKWEWARGERAVPLLPYACESPLEEIIDAGESLSLEALLFPLRAAIDRLAARLFGRAQLAAILRLHVRHEEGTSSHELELSAPQGEASRLFLLIREWLDALRWPAPLVSVRLTIPRLVPATPGQLLLWSTEVQSAASRAEFVSRLRARYGENAGFPRLCDSHFPERAFVLGAQPTQLTAVDRRHFPERPLFLLEPPQRLAGPPEELEEWLETIDAEWWGPRGRRRYYRARGPKKEHWWVFEDRRTDEWWVHGIFL